MSRRTPDQGSGANCGTIPRIDVAACTVPELLAGYGSILDELRRREIVRSSNNPVIDYAELLFCRAYPWTRENNSAAGYDARDRKGVRYQIKARRLSLRNGSPAQRHPQAGCRAL